MNTSQKKKRRYTSKNIGSRGSRRNTKRKDQGHTIYLYINTHGIISVKDNPKNNQPESLFNTITKFPSNLEHLNKVTLGQLGCPNYTNQVSTNQVKESLSRFINNSVTEDDYNIDDDLFAQTCQDIYGPVGKGIERRTIEILSTKTSKNRRNFNEFSNYCSTILHLLEDNFHSFIYKKKNRQHIDIPLIDKEYSYENGTIDAVYILYASGGMYKDDPEDTYQIHTHYNAKTQKSYFTLSALIHQLTQQGYTNIYIFDDSCNSTHGCIKGVNSSVCCF
jgi:hypothetical protein